MIPTVSRIVHYTSLGDRDGRYPPELQAALITKVSQHTNFNAEYVKSEEDKYHVSLRVFFEDGEFVMKQVPFTKAKAGTEEARGKWSWPERV